MPTTSSFDFPNTKPADDLNKKAAELAAKQQRKAAERRDSLQAGTEQLTIGAIRALPGVSSEVEKLLAGLQALVPSLAKTPTAPSASGHAFQPTGVMSSVSGQTFQQAGVMTEQCDGGDEFDRDFVYHPGRGKFVPVVHSPSRGGPSHTASRPVPRKQDISDNETSEDESCPVEPSPGYRLAWKRDESGEKYFIQKKTKKSSSPLVQTYVCDESTGRWYKRTVSHADLPSHPTPTSAQYTARGVTPLGSNKTAFYKDHRYGGSSPVPLVQRGARTPAAPAPLQVGERLPGIVPIHPEKQGRDSKVPDRVQWARNCPVNWTTKVTSANINVVLWAWSSIAEILATRTGMAPNLEQGELEARLQHLCHVLEITLQTSSQVDYGGDSWAVARLYDQKVQQKVDSKMFSWVQLSQMNHGASMPHELIAATQELAKKPKDVERRGAGDGRKGAGGKKDQPVKPFKCPTWNRSETRHKCTWEVDNAPDKCSGIHECSYCKSKSYPNVHHQRFFCRKRQEEEG